MGCSIHSEINNSNGEQRHCKRHFMYTSERKCYEQECCVKNTFRKMNEVLSTLVHFFLYKHAVAPYEILLRNGALNNVRNRN